MSAYWALGGDALLDTVGGEIERLGRERGPAVVGALWAIVVVKAVIALAAPAVVTPPAWLRGRTSGRAPRTVAWVVSVTVVAYGGSLTVGGLLVQSGFLQADVDADTKALAWHTYFWDPWFLLWGVAFMVGLWSSRSRTDV